MSESNDGMRFSVGRPSASFVAFRYETVVRKVREVVVEQRESMLAPNKASVTVAIARD